MWTAECVRCLPNPENYQNSDQIQSEKKNVAGPQSLKEVKVGAQSRTVSTFFFTFLKQR